MAVEILFDLIFMAECGIKIRGLGWEGYWHYSRDYPFNRLDFTLVMISVLLTTTPTAPSRTVQPQPQPTVGFQSRYRRLGGAFLPLDASYFRAIRYHNA